MELLVAEKWSFLSSREKEIIVYWIMDYNSKFIADTLCLSEHTIKTQIKKINIKLGVSSKASLIFKFFFETLNTT